MMCTNHFSGPKTSQRALFVLLSLTQTHSHSLFSPCHRPLYLLRYLKAKNTYPTKEVFIFKYIQIFNCNIWEIFHPVQFSVTSTEELNFGYSTANSWINQMWLEPISNVIRDWCQSIMTISTPFRICLPFIVLEQSINHLIIFNYQRTYLLR